MNKPVKVYKPSEEEILKNTLASFRLENIFISYKDAVHIFKKVLNKIKKENG
jgi:hypothetical protein